MTIIPQRDQADYVVTYEDRWMWDMRMYLRDFSIEVRDVRTYAVVGTGGSRQDSLATMGKTHRAQRDIAPTARKPLEGAFDRGNARIGSGPRRLTRYVRVEFWSWW